MIIKTFLSSTAIWLIIAMAAAGQGTEAFLREVASAHPVIKYYEGLLEASRAESVTGNTPGEFELGFGYFPGTPDAIGVKRTLEASQSFDFPTRYILRGRFNRESFALAETEFALGRLEKLLEARLLAYEYIAIQKKLTLLREKQNGYESLRVGWVTLLDEGAVTILDYNRLILEIARSNSEIASAEASMRAIKERLDYASGNRSDLLEGAGYDILEEPGLDALIETMRQQHPAFILKDREYSLAIREIDLSRAGNLPGIEVGFGSEIIAGEHHTGPKVGLSIPVWTNRNQVKLSRARSVAVDAGREASHLQLVSETRADYDTYSMIKENYNQTADLFSTAGDTDGLTQALNEKEITITEYFSYMDAVYATREMLIGLENEYSATLARLLDYKLALY